MANHRLLSKWICGSRIFVDVVVIFSCGPARDGAFLPSATAKMHRQISTSQLTSGIDVIGYIVLTRPTDVYSSWLPLNESRSLVPTRQH